MVSIRGGFCIDRYEISLVDAAAGRALSPYYHPTRAQTKATYSHWSKRNRTLDTLLGRSLEVPSPPAWQLETSFRVRARSSRGVKPSGYLNRDSAEAACAAAGKRLCRLAEWRMACRGERGTKYPYGADYRAGKCNIFRSSHPAAKIHGDASANHLDPRLNLVTEGADPLLRVTGASPDCASRWDDDAAYDMVGNLDEWVGDEAGVFVGGFFSRATREGCDAQVSSHAPEYFDYSLGARCCQSR